MEYVCRNKQPFFNMNIVITGAGKGIGLATVQQFLKDSDHRVWACSREVKGLETLAHPTLYPVTMDLTTCEASEIYDSVAACMDTVDILIHNAGILINKAFDATSLDDWRNVLETNLLAVVKVNQALLPLMKKSHQAHIVHIGSMGGVQGSSKFPGLSAYSASKAALANLSECMAEELKADGIHVNCLALGAVDTEMLRQAFPGYTASVNSREMAEFILDFSINRRHLFNGKIVSVSASTP